MTKEENLNNTTEKGYFIGFHSNDGDDTVYFEDGEIKATAYSCLEIGCVGSIGNVKLNKDQTYELFLAMKKYYDEVL